MPRSKKHSWRTKEDLAYQLTDNQLAEQNANRAKLQALVEI